MRIWDRQTGGQVHRLTKTGTISTLAVSRDGRWLLTGSESTDAQLWRMDDLAAPVARLSGHGGDISAAAFSPTADPGRPLVATGDVLGNVRLWSYDAASNLAKNEKNARRARPRLRHHRPEVHGRWAARALGQPGPHSARPRCGQRRATAA